MRSWAQVVEDFILVFLNVVIRFKRCHVVVWSQSRGLVFVHDVMGGKFAAISFRAVDFIWVFLRVFTECRYSWFSLAFLNFVMRRGWGEFLLDVSQFIFIFMESGCSGLILAFLQALIALRWLPAGFSALLWGLGAAGSVLIFLNVIRDVGVTSFD